LRFGRGAVDLIAQEQVAENWAGRKIKPRMAVAVFDENPGADQVSGHQVQRELDALEVQMQRPGERADEERFP
jgi:hypothetical protein